MRQDKKRPLCIAKYIVLSNGTLLTDVGNIQHVKVSTLHAADLVIVDKAGDLEVFKSRFHDYRVKSMTPARAMELVIDAVKHAQAVSAQTDVREISNAVADSVADHFEEALAEHMSLSHMKAELWETARSTVEEITRQAVLQLLK